LTIEKELKQEQVKHLDLHEFLLVNSGTPVQDVVDQMRHERRNCALVMQNNQLAGIFTERDVLEKVAPHPQSWQKSVDDLMTPAPKTLTPDSTAADALALMESGRFRNTPVVDADGAILGNVTYYAFIKFLADHFPQEIYNLPPDESIPEDRYGG